MNAVITELMAVSVGHTCNLVNLVMYNFHFDTLLSFDPIILVRLQLLAGFGLWQSLRHQVAAYQKNHTFLCQLNLSKLLEYKSDNKMDIAGILNGKQPHFLLVLISICQGNDGCYLVFHVLLGHAFMNMDQAFVTSLYIYRMWIAGYKYAEKSAALLHIT